MQTFPAVAGTKLVTYDFSDDTYTLAPILGWAHIQGNTAYPIMPLRNGGVTFGSAYLFSDATVYDPICEAYFTDLASWCEHIETAEAPKGKIVGSRLEPKDDPLAHVKEQEEEEDQDPLAHAKGDVEVNPAYEDVEFGTKTYKSNSFWVIENECVFTVPGEEPYPTSGAEKVKRTEYMALKRGDAGLPEVDYWEVRTDVAGVDADEDEGFDDRGYLEDVDDVL